MPAATAGIPRPQLDRPYSNVSASAARTPLQAGPTPGSMANRLQAHTRALHPDLALPNPSFLGLELCRMIRVNHAPSPRAQ